MPKKLLSEEDLGAWTIDDLKANMAVIQVHTALHEFFEAVIETLDQDELEELAVQVERAIDAKEDPDA